MNNKHDRRGHPRMNATYHCVVTSRGRAIAGLTHDVSPFDLSLYVAEDLALRETVDLKISIPLETIAIKAKAEVRYCIRNPNQARPDQAYLAGLEFTEGPIESFASSEAPELKSRYTPSHTVRIQDTPEQCYRLLGHFERYPEWSRGVEAASIVERHPDGRGKRVEFQHNFFLRRVTYILDYAYDDEHHTLSWQSAGGDDDILSITGKYSFTPDRDETLARYELDVTLSIIPTQYLVNYITSILMRQEMKNFMKFVEGQK